MITALMNKTFGERIRIAMLAGTLAIGSMLPVAPGMLASTDTVAPTTVVVSADQFDIDPSAGLTGLTARVNGGGEGANLRADAAHDAAVLTTVPDGTLVDLRVDMVDTVYDPDGVTRWWPVSVDGQDGWLSGAVLADSGSTTVPSDGTAGTSGTETVTSQVNRTAYEDTGLMVAEISADGEGLVMRSGPDRNSDKVMSLSDGTIVDLRIDMLDTVYDEQGTRWWPVSSDGVDGWVSGFYLIEPGTASSTSSSTAPTQGAFSAGDTVEVKTPSGRGLVVRVEASGDAERLTSLQEGQQVQVVEGPASFENSTNGWYLITTGDVSGYVDGDLLVLIEKPAPEAPEAPSTSDGAFKTGDWAEIRTSDGDGINLRAGASANSDQSGYAPNQALVEILSGPDNGWYEIRWDRQTGFIDGSLLIPAESPTLVDRSTTTDTDTQTETDTSTDIDVTAPDAAFASGDYGKVDAGSGVGVNIRSEPSQDADRAGYLPEDSVVKITEGPETDDGGNSWYRITDGSQSGWVRGDLLIPTEAPASAEEVATSEAADEAEDEGPSNQDATSGFILPLSSFTFTQDYGCSSLGFYSYNAEFGCSVHDGVDLAAPSGTPIHAVANGTVVAAGWCDCGLGYYVEIDHGGGVHTVYGHMASQPYVAVGQSVAQGDVIGPVGSTGLSTGPHTHFMVRQDGVTQDPKNYLPPLN